ncbi:Potassium ion channel yvc1 [Scedosporium apiospermum]|uniref:Potassium ion channel yvc1 n=1 Tax=Pseudallescheria apiosperma TaxID=563466 RepID=A0A084GEI1_PSEDA|nr:Potassium ion channel yvc1 [Scedosporium apiospermum]KEZ45743.1 Potassium ion channel yvc1 [Scedosporium apiospermum]
MASRNSRMTLGRLLGLSRDDNRSRREWDFEHRDPLLPQHSTGHLNPVVPPVEVTKVALRLRHLIEECVPCELEESLITQAHSRVITKKVILAAKEAGGEQYRSCVVFCLLVCSRWFKRQAILELWDADLHNVRSTACQVIAKAIIENEEDTSYLLHTLLLHRFSIIVNGKPTPPANAIEKAVDLHALRVICSSGYQKCLHYLWKGWLVQDEDDPTVFVDYKGRDDERYIVHLDPDRLRAPIYQNAARLLFSILYLVLYTMSINSVNWDGSFDAAEILLYLFTLGFICDELTKFWKAGYHILSFWTAFNSVLYAVLSVSFVFRIIGLAHPLGSDTRHQYDSLSYNFLAFSAPMFWIRLLLYLDSFRFFGAMLVVLKVMMKESIIFFALLAVVFVGFMQAFIGLDLAEDLETDEIWFIIQAMVNSIMGSPEFSGFEKFAPPFGILLYYIFTFIVMVILLNILIALYGSAYSDIYENADDEYMALFAQKTMSFVRAPDENVYIAPLNLVEVVVIVLFSWWLPKDKYELVNDVVMAVIYSPLLVVAAYFETRKAADVHRNRLRGEDDDDTVEEWEQLEDQVDFEAEGWTKRCEDVRANVEVDPAVVEVRRLMDEVAELKGLVEELKRGVEGKPKDEKGEGEGEGGEGGEGETAS